MTSLPHRTQSAYCQYKYMHSKIHGFFFLITDIATQQQKKKNFMCSFLVVLGFVSCLIQHCNIFSHISANLRKFLFSRPHNLWLGTCKGLYSRMSTTWARKWGRSGCWCNILLTPHPLCLVFFLFLFLFSPYYFPITELPRRAILSFLILLVTSR